MKELAKIMSISLIIAALATFSIQAVSFAAQELEGKVNINSATVEELTLLPSIGPKVAERIVEYRNANGAFKSTEELKNVKGIGEKTYAKLSGLIKISGSTDLHIAE